MRDALLTVLIVDDELPLRQRLQSLNWAAFGAVCIGEAQDGEEALSLCQELQPDVVITDITMPVMDGISLLIALKQQLPTIQVVLFTAHSDFDYAVKSLHYGALDYLLKMSFTEHDFVKLFDRARENLERAAVFQSSMTERHRWEKARELMLYLNRGSAIASSSEEAPASNMEGQRYAVLFTENRNQASLLLEKEVQDILVRREGRHDGFSFVPSQSGEWFLFMGTSPSPDVYWTGEIEQLLAQLQIRMEEKFSFVQYEIRWFAVLLSTPLLPESIRDDYLKVNKWKKGVFYQADSPLLFKGVPPELKSVTDAQEKSLQEEFRKVGRDPEQLCQFIDEGLRPYALSERWNPAELKQVLVRICTDLFREWGYHPKESGIAASLLQEESFGSFLEVLMHAIRNRGTVASLRSELREVKAMIEADLSQPITLNAIAAQVGLSPQYLGRLFRGETGESFNEYMTRLRMETAICLLNQTNLKVYEVAEKVGIPSYRYFSNVFREWTGLTPSDFKKG
ncbi:response regulator [Paenibacillus alba]|uniref:Response regulator n=1 Tax=Paenibacillus alba TaxID=1197127 RepID=A0ABU6G0L6_9BACL|nr:response regulator [Paenibacillus alba]MEC0227703.1 response regulator [Paenibacillus alba]